MKHRDFSLTPVHIIDRLHGSIPQVRLEEKRKLLRLEIQNIRKIIGGLPKDKRSKKQKQLLAKARAKFEFELDDLLHNDSNGPYYLENDAIAQIVIEAWKFQTLARGLVVIAVCIMSNHIHALVRGPDNGTILPAGPILHSVKSFSARKSNELLSRTHNPFWEHTYFDRDVREGKFMTVFWYIINNPVKAGLVDNWRDWPHTYVNPAYLNLLGIH